MPVLGTKHLFPGSKVLWEGTCKVRVTCHQKYPRKSLLLPLRLSRHDSMCGNLGPEWRPQMESSGGTGQGRRQGPGPRGLLLLQGSGPAAQGAWSPGPRTDMGCCESQQGAAWAVNAGRPHTPTEAHAPRRQGKRRPTPPSRVQASSRPAGPTSPILFLKEAGKDDIWG